MPRHWLRRKTEHSGDESLTLRRHSSRAYRSSKRSLWNRRLRLWGSFFCVFVLALFLVWWLLQRSQPVPLYVFAYTDYESPLPPNDWAHEDIEFFHCLFSQEAKKSLFLSRSPVQPVSLCNSRGGLCAVAREDLLNDLNKKLEIGLKQRRAGPSGEEGAVCIYLSAHGLVDRGSKPFLALGDYRDIWHDGPDTSRLKVKTLLDEINEVQNTHRRDRLVLLLLDATRVRTEWSTGVLRNEFSEALESLIDKGEIVIPKNLVLIVASSPGQASWAIPEQGGTVFGRAFARGLAGDADADEDRLVTLGELIEYLELEVEEDSFNWHYSLQQPKVYASEDVDLDRSIVDVDEDVQERLKQVSDCYEQTAQDNRVRDELNKLWIEHEKLSPFSQEIGSELSHPPSQYLVLYSVFEDGLLRLERLCNAGPAYRDKADELLENVAKLQDKLNDMKPIHRVAHSIGYLRKRNGETPAPLDISEFQALLSPPDEQEKETKERLQKKWDGMNYSDQAETALNWLLDASDIDYWTPKGFTKLLDRIDLSTNDTEYNELRVLRLLSSPGCLPASKGELLKAAFECCCNGDRAAALKHEPRSGDIIRPILLEADRIRLEGLDKLFHAEARAIDFQEANKLYSEAQTLNNQIDRALRLAEKALYCIPDYAELALHLGEAYPDSKENEQKRGIALDRAPQIFSRASESLKTAMDIVGVTRDYSDKYRKQRFLHPHWNPEDLEELRQILEQQCSSLSDNLRFLERKVDSLIAVLEGQKGVDRVSASHARILMRHPLLTGEQRKNLRNKYRSGGNKGEREAGTPEDVENAPVEGSRILNFAQQMRGSKPVASTDADAVSEKTLAEESFYLRTETQRLYSQITGGHSSLPQNSEGIELQLRDYWNTSRLLCVYGGLLPFDSHVWENCKGYVDPRLQLISHYESLRLLLHSERALNDCYGSGRPGGELELYFGKLCYAYLNASETIGEPLGRGNLLEERQQQLRERLEHYKQGVERFLADSEEIRRHVEPGKVEMSLPIPLAATELPAGTLSLSLQKANGQAIKSKSGERYMGYSVPRQSENKEVVVKFRRDDVVRSRRDDPESALSLKGLICLRGHVKQVPILITPLRPTHVVTWDPPRKPAKLTLLLRNRNLGSVAFLLDCSRSMEINNKMEAAKLALAEIIENTADTGYRLRLWLFGNRRRAIGGQSTEAEIKAYKYPGIWNPYWEDKEDPEIVPSKDFELVWGPRDRARFHKIEQLRELLNSEDQRIRPWGYTPLYAAMKEALLELSQEDPDSPRRLIIITDGGDLVIDSKSQQGTSLDPKEIVRSFREMNSQVQVTLLAPKSVAQSMEQLVQQQLNGTIVEIDFESKRLAQQLGLGWNFHGFDLYKKDEVFKSAIRSSEFPVTLLKKGTYHLETVNAGLKSGRPITSKPFLIEGGEDVVIELDSDNEKIFFLPDSDINIATSQVVRPPGATNDLKVSAEASGLSKGKSEREFLISFQNSTRSKNSKSNSKSEFYSKRPEQVWVEVQPMSGSSPIGDPFIFFDRTFLTDRRLPVLQLHVNESNWPKNCGDAHIRVWFSLEHKEDRPFRTIRELSSRNPELDIKVNRKGKDAELVAKVTKEIDGIAPELFSIETDPLPDRIDREFYKENGQVWHRFLFKDKKRIDVENDVLLLLQSGDDIKRQSTTVPALKVPVEKR